jgi:hypothetical protein
VSKQHPAAVPYDIAAQCTNLQVTVNIARSEENKWDVLTGMTVVFPGSASMSSTIPAVQI